MKHWLSDGLFRSVLRNSSYLGAAKLLSAPLGLLALACAGRELSPAAFGLLMVIHSYADGAGALAKFQTWQLIVRYGGPALSRGDPTTARDAIRFAFGLDIASGLVGMAGAVIALPFLAGRLGLSGTTLMFAYIYCTLVPTMTAATPTGVLRLFNRFDLIGLQQLMTPILRVADAVISYVSHLDFPGFIVTWYVADIAGDLTSWFFAAREVRRRNMADAMHPSLSVAKELREPWSFAWTTNVGHSLWAAWGPLSNIIIAAILGPVAAGLYKIASTFLDAAGKAADLLSRGFYPEIMRLDPTRTAPWRLGLRTGTVAGLIGLVMLLIVTVGGEPLIVATFGRKYLGSYRLLSLMTWSLALSMASFPLESLLYMVNRQRTVLLVRTAATLLYLAMLALLSAHDGIEGAGIAYVLGSVVMAASMFVPVIASYRRRASYAADIAVPASSR